MTADLSNFTDQETDDQNETGPSLKLYTAGSGNGTWAYVIKGSGEPTNKRKSYDGDTKGGFIPQLKAVAEGTEYLSEKYPNAELTIFTRHESIVDLVKGKNDPSGGYRHLYRKANRYYSKHQPRWSIEHIEEGKNNPANDLL